MAYTWNLYPDIQNKMWDIQDAKDDLLSLIDSKYYALNELFKERDIIKMVYSENKIKAKHNLSELKFTYLDKTSGLKKTDYFQQKEILLEKLKADYIKLKENYNIEAKVVYDKIKQYDLDIKNQKKEIANLKTDFKNLKLKFKDEIKTNSTNSLEIKKDVVKNQKIIIKKIKEDFKTQRKVILQNYKNLLANKNLIEDEKFDLRTNKYRELKKNSIEFKTELQTHTSQIVEVKGNYRESLGKDRDFNLNTVANAISIQSGKFAGSRIITSIMAGFFQNMPLSLAGAMWYLIVGVILSYDNGGIIYYINPNISEATKQALDNFREIGWRIQSACVIITALNLCFLVSSNMAKSYKLDTPWMVGVISVACMVAIMPINTYSWGYDRIVDTNFTSTNSLFTGMVVAIVTTTLFRKLSFIDKIKIKLPPSVPPSVAKPFNVMIPTFMVISIFAVVGTAFSLIGNFVGTVELVDANGNVTTGNFIVNGIIVDITTFQGIVNTIFMVPLSYLANGFSGWLIMNFFYGFIFWLGIHPSSILDPIRNSMWANNILENQLNGGNYVNSGANISAFMNIGGTSGTLMLIVAILVFSKRKELRTIAIIGLIPGLFNISEPILFGLPIVLNIVWFIPFVIVPVANAIIIYLAMDWGLVNVATSENPWTLPLFIGGFLNTALDWKAIVLWFACAGVYFAGYMPFVKIADKQAKEKDENKTAKESKHKNKLIEGVSANVKNFISM